MKDQQCIPNSFRCCLSVCYPTLVADICRRETPVEAISEQVRAVVEELWADLVPKLPPRVSQG